MKEDKNDLRKIFQQTIANKPIIGSIMKYHEVKNSNYYKHIIFVEGKSDKRFYVNTSIKELSQQPYYIYAVQGEKVVGKEAVLSAYYRIANDDCLNDGLQKCIFIVDRDWDDIPKGLFVTKGHSMENYFLQEDNLKEIFRVIGKDDADYSAFLVQYRKFFRETVDFWALKATITNACDKGLCTYRKKYSFDAIFEFGLDRDGCISYNKQMMREEEKFMKEAISESSEMLDYYSTIRVKIKNDKGSVRGHEAFRFLQYYFYEYFGRIVDLYGRESHILRESIRHFKVELLSNEEELI